MPADDPSPRPKRRVNARGRVARDRLMSAAANSFAARGFYGTSTRDITDAAGMSPGALYAHYATKEEVLYELSLEGHREIQQVIAEAAAVHTDPVSRMRSVFHAYARWHAERHTSARVAQVELTSLTDVHFRVIAQVRREIADQFRALVSDGCRDGVFRVPDEPTATLALLSLGVDISRWYSESGGWTPETIADRYAVLALQMLGHVEPV